MRRWWWLAAAVFAVSGSAGVFTGASMSKAYWGYVIRKPPMFSEVGDATSVRRISDVKVVDDVPDPATESTETPADPTLDVPALIATLRSGGIPVEGDLGYQRSSHRLWGDAIEFGDAAVRPLLLVMIGSDEVENDHYPRYEVSLTRAGSTWRVQATVAGATAVVVKLFQGRRSAVPPAGPRVASPAP